MDNVMIKHSALLLELCCSIRAAADLR